MAENVTPYHYEDNRHGDHSSLEPLPKEVSVASSLIPYKRDDYRARYLGYLCCGFGVREALQMTGVTKAALSLWRKDAEFSSLESRTPEFRQSLAKEYTELEFFRNFRLALEKDYRILWKSIHPEKMEVFNVDGTTKLVDTPLDKQEHEYLLKIRSQYSIEQLHMLEAIVSGSGDGFNFAKWVSENQEIVQFSRTDSVTIKKGSNAPETEDS